MANTSYIGVGPADRDPTVSDNSVTEGKIANDAVTNTKIADNAVDGAQIALTGNVQGAVMYYNGTDWVVLTPGTSGEALKTQGTGQNVVWGAVSSTGDFANGGDTATANRTLGNNDNYAMGFETNAINWLNINTDGIPQITGGLSANFDTAGVGTTLSSGIDAVCNNYTHNQFYRISSYRNSRSGNRRNYIYRCGGKYFNRGYKRC